MVTQDDDALADHVGLRVVTVCAASFPGRATGLIGRDVARRVASLTA